MTPREEVAHWIIQREQARLHHDNPKHLPAYDKIITTYRFCNVRREDDKVTRWLAKHWRTEWKDKNFVAAMLLARMINWPPTLNKIGYPHEWDTEYLVSEINRLASLGNKVWTSAYVITTCGAPMDKAQYVVQSVCQQALGPRYRVNVQNGLDTCEAVWTRLRGIPGLGAGFLAAQVVADLKYTPLLKDASDWKTFAVPGPGSKRGINRYFGYHLTTNWPYRQQWKKHLDQMIEEVTPLLPKNLRDIHAQDWQNVMCEYDKWKRAKNGEGRPRQRYRPSDAYQV